MLLLHTHTHTYRFVRIAVRFSGPMAMMGWARCTAHTTMYHDDDDKNDFCSMSAGARARVCVCTMYISNLCCANRFYIENEGLLLQQKSTALFCFCFCFLLCFAIFWLRPAGSIAFHSFHLFVLFFDCLSILHCCSFLFLIILCKLIVLWFLVVTLSPRMLSCVFIDVLLWRLI